LDVGVVDEIEFGTVLVENGERAVETRAGPRGVEVKDNRLTGVRVEAKDVVVVDVEHAIDHGWQLDGLGVLQIVVRFGVVHAGKRTDLKHTHVRAHRRSQAEIVQADRHVRTDCDMDLHEKEVGDQNLAFDIRPGKNDLAGPLQIAAQELYVEGLSLPRAERRNGNHDRGQFGQRHVASSNRSDGEDGANRTANGFHRKKLPRRKHTLQRRTTHSTPARRATPLWRVLRDLYVRFVTNRRQAPLSTCVRPFDPSP